MSGDGDHEIADLRAAVDRLGRVTFLPGEVKIAVRLAFEVIASQALELERLQRDVERLSRRNDA